jgi:hypothetical protein
MTYPNLLMTTSLEHIACWRHIVERTRGNRGQLVLELEDIERAIVSVRRIIGGQMIEGRERVQKT